MSKNSFRAVNVRQFSSESWHSAPCFTHLWSTASSLLVLSFTLYFPVILAFLAFSPSSSYSGPGVPAYQWPSDAAKYIKRNFPGSCEPIPSCYSFYNLHVNQISRFYSCMIESGCLAEEIYWKSLDTSCLNFFGSQVGQTMNNSTFISRQLSLITLFTPWFFFFSFTELPWFHYCLCSAWGKANIFFEPLRG